MYTISEALQRVADLKRDYESNLKGKTFLYVYIDKNIICAENVPFKAENYLHLTGLDYKGAKTYFLQNGRKIPTHAKEFYYGLDNPASIASDVSFAQGRTFSETQRVFHQTQNKLNNLSKLVQIAKKAEYIGIYQGNQNFDLIVNRSQCSLAVQNFDGINCPTSLLSGGIEQLTSSHQKIFAIFCKEDEHSPYRLSYLNKNINIGKKLFSQELSMLLSPDSFSNLETKFNEKSLYDFINSFEISVRKYLSQDLEKIAELRSHVYDSEEAYEKYAEAWNFFYNAIDSIFKAEIALGILAEQYENKLDSLTSEEYKNIKDKFTDVSAPELSSNIMKFENNMLHDISSDNVLAVSLQDSFTEAIRSLAEQFRTALREITDKITVVIRQALSKSQNADAVPSATVEQTVQQEAESKIEPAPEDDDRFIIKDIYSIFVSNTGVQGYESYVMIIPASELDFQIPLTYETEQKNQEQEHDFLSERAVPTEFKKKQVEYDDF